jgi:NADPH:quinone reductase-like Zn-dependent oxidoreductase
MIQVVVEKAGGYDHLKIKESPHPQPRKGEVLIEVKACGVNFADCVLRMGVYSSAKKYGWPITPGFEVSGIIREAGEGVSSFSPGQKVIALTLFGGYTTHLAVPEKQVLALPEGWSFEQGAAIPVIFLTAYYALFFLAHPRKGDLLLVHSAAGGVGSSLVQLGKITGCEVVGVVGASHKADLVKELGADAVIDKSQMPLWKEAEAIAPQGFDVVLDANGAETLKESYAHLKSGGKLVVYGFHTMFSKGRGKPNWIKMIWDYFRTPCFNPLKMTNDNHSVLAFNLSYLFDKTDLLQEAMQKILDWFKEKKLKAPPIQTYPLEEAARAHQDLESGQTVGKLVLIN